MLGSLREAAKLWFREKTGLTAAFVALSLTAVTALATAFVFLCVSGYAWAAVKLGPIFGGLASAGVFLDLAVCAAGLAVLSRAQARKTAYLQQAVRARRNSPLLDPRLFRTAMTAGRVIGWQRVIPIALLGFLATQIAREQRGGSDGM